MVTNQTLKELDISNFQLFPDDIFSVLCDNCTLEKLSISVEKQSAEFVCELLVTNRTLKVLQLSSSAKNFEGASMIAKAMCENSTLAELCIPGNSIGLDGADALADMLKINTSLKELQIIDWNSDLETNEFSDYNTWAGEFLFLTKALSHNTSLVKLTIVAPLLGDNSTYDFIKEIIATECAKDERLSTTKERRYSL